MYISSCAAESDHYLNLKKSLLFYQTSSTLNQKKRMYFKTSSAPQTKPSCSTKRVLKRALCSTKRALCSVKTADIFFHTSPRKGVSSLTHPFTFLPNEPLTEDLCFYQKSHPFH